MGRGGRRVLPRSLLGIFFVLKTSNKNALIQICRKINLQSTTTNQPQLFPPPPTKKNNNKGRGFEKERTDWSIIKGHPLPDFSGHYHVLERKRVTGILDGFIGPGTLKEKPFNTR